MIFLFWWSFVASRASIGFIIDFFPISFLRLIAVCGNLKWLALWVLSFVAITAKPDHGKRRGSSFLWALISMRIQARLNFTSVRIKTELTQIFFQWTPCRHNAPIMIFTYASNWLQPPPWENYLLFPKLKVVFTDFLKGKLVLSPNCF